MTIEKNLLIYWWHHYGKIPYTLAELEEFEKIMEKYGTDKVFECAVASYVCDDGSPTVLLASIRNNSVEELFDSLPNIEEMSEKEKETHNLFRNRFFNIISAPYNK